jgi:hypothetical protein
MNFDFVKTIVSALVFVFLLIIIVNHVINLWFSGKIHESVRNGLEGFEDATASAAPSSAAPSSAAPSSAAPSTAAPTIPTSIPSSSIPSATTTAPTDKPDYATENSENMADLFDKVNTQIDMIRTIKEPYSESVATVKYNRDLSSNLIVFTNLQSLVNIGIAPNDKDLQTNPGIVKLFQYGGNDSIGEIVTDLASIDETKLTELCKKTDTSLCDRITSEIDRATCLAKIQKQCVREIEASYIKRVKTVVEGHQRTLDRILKKQSQN